jgi:hypothetical protein
MDLVLGFPPFKRENYIGEDSGKRKRLVIKDRPPVSFRNFGQSNDD